MVNDSAGAAGFRNILLPMLPHYFLPSVCAKHTFSANFPRSYTIFFFFQTDINTEPLLLLFELRNPIILLIRFIKRMIHPKIFIRDFLIKSFWLLVFCDV